MSIVFDPIWGWILDLAALAGLVGLVLATYPQSIRHLSPASQRSLLGLRLGAVLLLAVAMLRPALQFTKTDSSSVTMAVLCDRSRSMKTQDGPGGITRRQALVRTLSEVRPEFEKLSKRLDVRFYDFDAQLRTTSFPEGTAEGNRTAMGFALESLLRESAGENLASVLLLGDGAQRAVAPDNVDPRTVARRFRDLQIPIHTICYGVSGIEGAAFDLAVEDLVVEPNVFVKKTVPVTAKIRALGAADRPLTVRLLVEDRSAVNDGRPVAMTVPPATNGTVPSVRLETARNSDIIPVELSFVPLQAGEFKIALEVVPLDGELRTENNRQHTIISVQKGGINVEYFDRARFEAKYIRAINRDRQIQVDFRLVLGADSRGHSQIDPAWFDPGRYDVYIIGSVPASAFGPELIQKLADRVREGAGLLMIGGYQSFGPGGYAPTPLADLLPVDMSTAEFQPENEVSGANHYLRDLKMLPTETGLRHYIMRIAPDSQNLAEWKSLPPLEGANRLRRKNQLVDVLAQTEDGIPLLLANDTGRARVIAFAADSTRLWYSFGHAEVHQRFWRQMILWLARKELETDQQIWVRIDPRNYTPGQPVQLAFGARSEDGAPIPDADYSVEVTTPQKEQHQVPWERRGDEQVADFAKTNRPGDYWVTVNARRGDKLLGFGAVSRFLVDDRDLELDNPAADPVLMEEISALTGGLSLPPEGLRSYLRRLIEEGPLNTQVTQTRQITLWDHWGLMLLFVAVMTAEWFVRKRRGLV